MIEHTPNPRQMLDRCRELLKPGGVLVVNFPDIGSWIAQAMGRRWLFLTSVHLFYFDRSTMRRMLESAGYHRRAHATARSAARTGLHPVPRIDPERHALTIRAGGGQNGRFEPRARPVLARTNADDRAASVVVVGVRGPPLRLCYSGKVIHEQAAAPAGTRFGFCRSGMRVVAQPARTDSATAPAAASTNSSTAAPAYHSHSGIW